MSDAIVSTVIGVVGTGLIGMFFMQLQNLRDDLRQGFREQGDSIKSLEAVVVQLNETVKDHGVRLARLEETVKDYGVRLARLEEAVNDYGVRLVRIEAKLDGYPPAEAA